MKISTDYLELPAPPGWEEWPIVRRILYLRAIEELYNAENVAPVWLHSPGTRTYQVCIAVQLQGFRELDLPF